MLDSAPEFISSVFADPDVTYKQPVSVLIVIHTRELDVLLLERTALPGLWQSVTGSREGDESLVETARREVEEETGIQMAENALCNWRLRNRFEIFHIWRQRYGPGITHNDEHVFSVQLEERRDVVLAPKEHCQFQWLPWREAAAACFSWTNRDAILMLPLHAAGIAQ